MGKLIFVLGILFSCNVVFAQLQVNEVSPISANFLVNSFTDVNVVMYDKNGSPRNKLVVMLANTGDVPSDFRRFDTLAAKTGFHVMGISYNNSPSVLDICQNKTDPDCYENIRRQVVMGEILSPDVQVDTNHHIVRRIKDMLVYLDTSLPDQNWGQYLDSDKKVQWENVIVAGHGEGATYAAFMGKLFNLSRVLSFAPLPEKMRFNNKLASWVSFDGLTQEHNYYLFYQEKDTNTVDTNFYNQIGYTNYGGRTYVEDAPYPYNLSRDLSTRFISNRDHTITIKDIDTPSEPDGSPRFGQVWTYMLTNESFQSVLDISKSIMVYPNPFKGNITISIKENTSSPKWQIVDALGRDILKGDGFIVNTANLHSGVYFMTVVTLNGRGNLRIIKE